VLVPCQTLPETVIRESFVAVIGPYRPQLA
jgi:hypothetical protein